MWQADADGGSDDERAANLFIHQSSDNDLDGGPVKGANEDWTPGRRADVAEPGLYHLASNDLRARLRAIRS